MFTELLPVRPSLAIGTAPLIYPRAFSMIRVHLAAFVTSLVSLALPASAMSLQGDTAALLMEASQRAPQLSIDEIWETSTSLIDRADRLEGTSLDALLDRALSEVAPSPRVELLRIAARLQGDEADLDLLSEHLITLLSSEDREVAGAAASLFSDSQFMAVDDEVRNELVEALLAGAQDGERAPAFRIECATSAIERGNGAQSRAGRRELLGFLESSDSGLRGQAALALARAGDGQTVRGELERLAALPSAQGRLAAAMIRQEEIIEHKERAQRNLRKYFMDKLEQAEDGGTLTQEAKMIENLLQMVEQRHLEGDSFDREELISSAMNGLLQRLDRHSTFMTPEEFKSFSQDLLNPEYGGIGAYVGEDPDDRLFSITRPIYSGPAYKAGLLTGDKIVRIEDWPTLGESTDDIIKRLKGKPGTPVKLYIWKNGMDGELIDRPTEDMAVTVVREIIQIPPVRAEMLPGNIGLIELTTFSRGCSELMRDKLEEMLEQGMTSVVLDLRRNLGGLMVEARDVVDLFLEPGKLVVSTESRIESPKSLSTVRPALIPEDMPLTVLIDRFSASASEIVSGALQDHARATLIGQRSFGKGSVQDLISLRGERDDLFKDENHNQAFDEWETITKDYNGNGEFDYAPKVKMTISRYMLPSGRSIHRELDREGNLESPGGVSPDIEANPRSWAQWKREEFVRLAGDRAARKWADEHYPENKELFVELAASDRHDPNLYPGFDAFYASLDTVLPKDDVRFLLRSEVRRRVQDDRGAAFPSGDYGEDPMLQEAIRALYDERGLSYLDVDEYAAVFTLKPRQKGTKQVSAIEVEKANLDGALTLLDGARKAGGQLTMTEIQELVELLHSLEKE